jgi:hypothetical protein
MVVMTQSIKQSLPTQYWTSVTLKASLNSTQVSKVTHAVSGDMGLRGTTGVEWILLVDRRVFSSDG